jgi:hypothetical protein
MFDQTHGSTLGRPGRASGGGPTVTRRRSSGKSTAFGIIGVLALMGTVVGCSSSDDDLAAAESERDAALEQVKSVEQERDDLAAQVAESESTIESLTTERDDAISESEQAAADLAAETARADEAQTKLDELGVAIDDAFPISVSTSLVGQDLAGTYSVKYTEAYCDLATSCGTTPNANTATVGTTPEGWLDLTVYGVLRAGLFAVEGGLYGITDSDTALAPCGDTPRRARITVTMFPPDLTVDQDGTRLVDTLQASITLDTQTVGDCPGGLVFWAAVLTPTG